jgi:hypothetical protein
VTEVLYVPTDSGGVEHAAEGPISWSLPGVGSPGRTERPAGLRLRTPVALLGALDEVIYRAEPLGEGDADADGILEVPAAQLVSKTPWGTEAATRFALSCADHVLGDKAEVQLPDGTSLGKVVTDAQRYLDEEASVGGLGYLAGLSALWHLHRDRRDISEITFGLMAEDEANDVEALEDPAYATVVPLVDAVLAAIEALRHHALSNGGQRGEDRRVEREQHKSLDEGSDLGIASPKVTPFGNVSLGGGPPLSAFEPAWTSAREAARHARIAARDAGGVAGEQSEREWQGATLGRLLESR